MVQLLHDLRFSLQSLRLHSSFMHCFHSNSCRRGFVCGHADLAEAALSEAHAGHLVAAVRNAPLLPADQVLVPEASTHCMSGNAEPMELHRWEIIPGSIISHDPLHKLLVIELAITIPVNCLEHFLQGLICPFLGGECLEHFAKLIGRDDTIAINVEPLECFKNPLRTNLTVNFARGSVITGWGCTFFPRFKSLGTPKEVASALSVCCRTCTSTAQRRAGTIP
mmetsp:Transcript_154123/g.287322  ORF Transcript_154123/g.287322 Transcript_154123/m.287322 type:complete len:223 (+) Transcript_154123:1275-1943(+)